MHFFLILTVALCSPQTACVSQFPNDSNVKVKVGKFSIINFVMFHILTQFMSLALKIAETVMISILKYLILHYMYVRVAVLLLGYYM